MLRRLALALLLLAALAAPGAAALRIPPPPDHRVSDYAGALAPADRDRLEQADTPPLGPRPSQVVPKPKAHGKPKRTGSANQP